MLNLLDVVGQLAEQERVDSEHLTCHSPYDVACNSERHFCPTLVEGHRVELALCLAASAGTGTTCCGYSTWRD